MQPNDCVQVVISKIIVAISITICYYLNVSKQYISVQYSNDFNNSHSRSLFQTIFPTMTTTSYGIGGNRECALEKVQCLC